MRYIIAPLPLFLLALLCVAPATSRGQSAAGEAAALQTLVSNFYKPYIRTPAGQEPDDAAVIAAHATPALVRLIQNDRKCQIRSQGVCNLDFDIIISGQDWDLAAPPHVTIRQANAQQIIIASQFTNDGSKAEVDYIFINAGGKWLINDMTESDSEHNDWRLTKLLAHEPG